MASVHPKPAALPKHVAVPLPSLRKTGGTSVQVIDVRQKVQEMSKIDLFVHCALTLIKLAPSTVFGHHRSW